MDPLLHLFCQGYLWGHSPAAGCASLGFLSSLEDDGEALVHMQEGPHDSPLILLLHKPPRGCHQSHGVVTELPPSWGALGQEQSSSAFEASLHPYPVAPHSLSPEWAGLATGDLLLGLLF